MTGGGSGFLTALTRRDQHHQDAEVGWIHAADAAGLAEVFRTELVEFQGAFTAQAGDRQIIERGGDFDFLDVLQLFDLPALAFQVSAISHAIEHLLAHRLGFGQKLGRQCGRDFIPPDGVGPRATGRLVIFEVVLPVRDAFEFDRNISITR